MFKSGLRIGRMQHSSRAHAAIHAVFEQDLTVEDGVFTIS